VTNQNPTDLKYKIRMRQLHITETTASTPTKFCTVINTDGLRF